MDEPDNNKMSKDVYVDNWLLNKKNAKLIKENEKLIAFILLSGFLLFLLLLLIY